MCIDVHMLDRVTTVHMVESRTYKGGGDCGVELQLTGLYLLFLICLSNEYVLYLQCLKIIDLTDNYYISAMARHHSSVHLCLILAL